MKKRLLFTYITLFSIIIPLLGQQYNRPPNMLEYDEKQWHFGFTLGTEFQNMRIVNSASNILSTPGFTPPSANYGGIKGVYYYSEIPQISTGFHVGIITSCRLSNYFNLRMIPSLSLGQRRVNSKMYIEEINGEETIIYPSSEAPISTTIKSTQLSLPILFKYKSVRINNFRPYIIVGSNFKCDLTTDLEEAITLKRFDSFLEFGFGSDFYLTTFRLGVELRFGIGFMDMLQDNRPENDPIPYITPSISKLKAKTFTIAINFE